MPIDLLMPLQPFLKFEKYCIDNNVFRLHYRFTVVMLLFFSLSISIKQFFGEPILCTTAGHVETAKDLVNTYCWMHGTYTVKSHFFGKTGKTNVYPGVGPNEGQTVHYAYYQWVPIVLLTQAFIFYTPRYMWKLWERGTLKALAENLASPMVPKEWNKKRKAQLVQYLTSTNIYTHNVYAFRFAFCELINCINVILQIFFLDLFLGGSFTNYGVAFATAFKSYNASQFAIEDPMAMYFPKETKCDFRTYGPSGGIQKHDYLCILPYNVINEKIFVLLWFWFLFLACISVIAVLFRLVVFTIQPLRTYLIFGQLRYTPKHHVNKVVSKFRFGDWFVLYQLGKNLNSVVYKELIIDLSNELDTKPILV